MAREEKEVKTWIVKEPFYDNLQKREVEVGEEVEHTAKREQLKLIEKK